MATSSNMRGALFMSVSMAGFTMNDAITKFVSAEMNMGQVMLIRGIFASLLIGLIAWRTGALVNFRRSLHPTVGLRVLGEAGGTVSFLVALAHLPIATVSAVLQALPLGVTMGAALFFSEPVGWRRWLAIGFGFLGVLIIVRPGMEGFSVYALSALLCVVFCTVRDLATRRVPKEIPSVFMSFATAVSVTVLGAALVVPFGGWSPVSASSTGLLAGAAVMLLFGYQFIIMAMRVGDISFVAPFRYTALLWAILLGFLVFSDVPDLAMVVGASIIVGSGLYALYRERVVGRMKPVAVSTAPGMAPDGI